MAEFNVSLAVQDLYKIAREYNNEVSAVSYDIPKIFLCNVHRPKIWFQIWNSMQYCIGGIFRERFILANLAN